MTASQRMGNGDVHEFEAITEVSPALIGALQDKLGVFIEGRACTESGAVTDVYDFLYAASNYLRRKRRTGNHSYLSIGSLSRWGKVSLEPYEFKAPKITVVYKDDLINLRPPKNERLDVLV